MLIIILRNPVDEIRSGEKPRKHSPRDFDLSLSLRGGLNWDMET